MSPLWSYVQPQRLLLVKRLLWRLLWRLLTRLPVRLPLLVRVRVRLRSPQSPQQRCEPPLRGPQPQSATQPSVQRCPLISLSQCRHLQPMGVGDATPA